MTEVKRQEKNYMLAAATTIAVFCMGQIPGSIDAAISKISIEFNLNEATGLYITTVACIVSVVFSILLGFIAGKKVGYKPLILFCATVELITSLLPFFSSTFVGLIILRGLFGIGFGGMQSMENTVAATLITPGKRAKILGLGMFFGFGANCILQFIGGLLADIGWNYVFLNHLLLIIPYVIVLIGCSKLDFTPGQFDGAEAAAVAADGASGERESNAASKQPNGITLPVVQMWIMMLLVGIFIAPLLVGCSFLSEPINPSATVAGVVAVFFSVGCMLGGLCYPHIYKKLEKNALSLFLIMMIVGIAGCGIARNIPLLCAFIFIAGMSFSMTMSMSMMILTLSTTPAMIAMASAIMMALYNLGMFLCTSYESVVGMITGDSLYMPLYIGSAVLVVITAVYAVVNPLKKD